MSRSSVSARVVATEVRLERWYKDENIRPQKVMEFGTLETILSSVTVGLGVTFCPEVSSGSIW